MRDDKRSILSVILVLFAIFMVVAVWFPMFVRTRECVRPNCQGNLKQCAQTLKMYSDDYNGQMPSSYLVSRSKRWNTPDFLAFTTKLGEYPPKANSKHTVWQILYDNMRNKDIPFCYAAPEYEEARDAGRGLTPSTRPSYYYKLANDKAWYGLGCEAPRRRMGDYAYESDQIAFYERLGWHFNDTKGLHNGVQINVVFMDTRVETIVIRNATSGDPINCAANTDGEPMYYNCGVEPKHGYPKTQTGPAKLTDPACCYDRF